MRTMLSCLAAAALSGNALATDLTVTIDNVANAEGHLRLALYQGPERFLVQPLQRESLPATPGRMVFAFRDLPPGRYAATGFHDLNDNKKIDTDQFGRPLEPTAFSRNAKGNGGPPSFEDAAFEVGSQAAQITLHLRPGMQP
ncbi:MAG: DUF2141 domain-containing protein [Rhodocyclales bacterium GT-UBC]|nr:MAG: DUF2141 domain-containing protein [Rhodocyclales bacterium GT-UBC]